MFHRYFREHQWIPESFYPEIFANGGGFDFKLTTRDGTPLNNLTTNRQRFLVDNSEQWQALLAARKATTVEAAETEKEHRKLQKDIDDAARPKKTRSCSHLGCQIVIDITSYSLKKSNEGTWKKCKGKGFSTWACPDHFKGIEEHEIICLKCTA